MSRAWGPAPTAAVLCALSCLWFASTVSGQSKSVGLDTSLVDGCVEATLASLSANNRTGRAVEVEDIQSVLLSIYLPCMNYADERKELVVVWPPNDVNLDTYQAYANLYMARVPVVIKISAVPITEMADRVLRELNDSNGGHNLTVFASDSPRLGELVESGALYDLLSFLKADSTYNWAGVLRLFKDQIASFGSIPIGIPTTGPLLHLFYRRDIFEKHSIPVPNTWDELVSAAQKLSSVDVDADGLADPPVCSEFVSGDRSNEGFLAVLSSYVQTAGSDQGVLFSSDDMASLLNTPAAAQSLQVMAALHTHSPDVHDSSELEDMFLKGKCGITISDGTLFKKAHLAYLLPSVGIAPLPGTSKVYDKGTRKLVPCTTSLCPHARNGTIGKDPLVNWVPYSPLTTNNMMHIFSRASQGSQKAGYNWFASVNGPETSSYFVTSPQVLQEPFRAVHLQELSWIPFGYDTTALRDYLASVSLSGSSGNGATCPRFINATSVLQLLNTTVSRYLAGLASDAETLAELDSGLQRVMRQGPTADAIARSYRSSLNWMNRTAVPGPGQGQTGDSPTGRGHSGLDTHILVPAVVVPTVVLMLLVAITLLFTFHVKRDPRRNLVGHVVPPPISSNSTVVVADVQDLVTLWERIPRDVMQNVVQLFTRCMAQLLKKHCGYQSSCHDLSYVLVFHNSKDALLFCMELQGSLLDIPWPSELLEMEMCHPCWIKYMENVAEVALPGVEGKQEDEDEAPAAGKEAQIAAGAASTTNAGTAEEAGQIGAGHVTISITNATGNADADGCYTFRSACKQHWLVVSETEPGAVLVSRGLRVRCGMHTGLDEHDSMSPGPDSRMEYKGPSVALTKAICAATQGGMSTISESSYRQLPMEDLWEKVMVLHGGEHELTDVLGCVNLYMVINRHLRGRMGPLPPLMSDRQLSLGAIDAPLGRITIVFLNIMGTQVLQSWNADIAQQAVQMFHNTVGGLLQRFNGYQVEATDSLLLASFHHPADAILWCLESQRRLLKLHWPKELLQHELGEEVVVSLPTESGRMQERVVLRGLRIKAGIDLSDAKGSVHAITGRITYRGKMMNRAARIAVTATTGQILGSADVWTQANARDDPRIRGLDAVNLGLFTLKGVAEKMQVYQIRYSAGKESQYRRFSDPLNRNSDFGTDHGPSSRRSSIAVVGSSRSLTGVSFYSQTRSTVNPETPSPATLLPRSHSRRHSYLIQNLEDIDSIEMVEINTVNSSSRNIMSIPPPLAVPTGEHLHRDKRASRRAMERLSQLMSPADLDLFLAKLSEASASPASPGEG